MEFNSEENVNGIDLPYLPGAAALMDQIDTRILLVLRDGRNLIGTLRTYDQYMNLVLEDTVERVLYQGIIIKLLSYFFI
jgi:small nuclear ribonucleoprotein (snRNP)-like protein